VYSRLFAVNLFWRGCAVLWFVTGSITENFANDYKPTLLFAFADQNTVAFLLQVVVIPNQTVAKIYQNR
jgi:hypothetical protein